MGIRKAAAAKVLTSLLEELHEHELGELVLDVPYHAQTFLGLPEQMTARAYVDYLTSKKSPRSHVWERYWQEARIALRRRVWAASREQLSSSGRGVELDDVKSPSALDAWAVAHSMTQWLDLPLDEFARTFDLPGPNLAHHHVLVLDVLSYTTYKALFTEAFPRKLSEGVRSTLEALAMMTEEGEGALEERVALLDVPGRPGLSSMGSAIASLIRSSGLVWLRPDGPPQFHILSEGEHVGGFYYGDRGLAPCNIGGFAHATVDLSRRRIGASCTSCGDDVGMCAVRVDALLIAAEHIRDAPKAYAEVEAYWKPSEPSEWFERAQLDLDAEADDDPDDSWFAWRVSTRVGHDDVVVEPAWARHKKTGPGFVTKTIGKTRALELLYDESTGPQDQRALTAWVLLQDGASSRRRKHLNQALLALSRCEHVYYHDRRSRPLELRVVEPTLELVASGDGASLMLRVGPELLDVDRAEPIIEDLIARDRLEYELDKDASTLTILRLLPRNERLICRWIDDAFEHIGHDALEGVVARAHTLTGSGALTLGESLRGEPVPPDDTARLMLRFNGHAVRARVASRPLGTLGALQVPGEGAEVVYGLRDTQPVHTRRLLVDELEAARLAAAELRLDPALAHDWEWQLDDLDEALDLVALAQDLNERGELEVLWDTRPVALAPSVDFDDLRVDVDMMDRYLKIGGEVDLTDHGGASLETLLALSREGRRWLQLSGGGWTRVEGRLLDALSDVARAQSDGGALSPLAAPQLLALEELGAQVSGPQRWLELHQRIGEAAALEPSLPEGLDATLRPYQRDGYDWLVRLAHWAPGAILADDMGLGKTVQALALLLARMELGPALIVAPTSLGSNWRREAARFAPSLSFTLARSGAQLDELPDPGAGDVWVMSYELAARHAGRIESIAWATHALDEAQAIKNPETLRSKTSRSVGAQFTLALSGTPVENRALELWSLTSTVTPGLLGRRADFERQYARVIERGAPEDAARARRALAASVSPFILRRTKREVAADLPERIDVRVDVELSPAARALYDELRRAALLHQLDADADAIQLLAALTRLRQIACHPRLFLPDSAAPSSKLTVLRERVAEAIGDQSRCLVFSQFTSLLDLAQEALRGDGVRCVRLDGSMSAAAREAAVEAFQSGEADVFLLSIKAGGTGLNLTAATSVFILDPWWNPAVEDQAADRAHRIGQTEPVTVYRLIARGTIEEAIYEMHAAKRALAEDLLAGSSSARPLGVAELRRLLSISPEDFEDFTPEELAPEDLASEDLTAPARPVPSPASDTAAAPATAPDDDLHARVDAALDALVGLGEIAASSRRVYNKGIHDAARWLNASGLTLDDPMPGLTARYALDVEEGRWEASMTQVKTIKSSLKWLQRALEHAQI